MATAALSRRHAALLLAGLPWCLRAQAADSKAADACEWLPAARLQGQGRLTFLGLNVYSAKLWVLAGFKPDEFTHQPLVLELEYARSLTGRLIAERSLVEMKRAGDVPETRARPWLAAMSQAFPDVVKGDRLSGLYQPDEGMRFFCNGKPCGEVRDAMFAQRFIGIWLSPHTSEPQLRQALLGAA